MGDIPASSPPVASRCRRPGSDAGGPERREHRLEARDLGSHGPGVTRGGQVRPGALEVGEPGPQQAAGGDGAVLGPEPAPGQAGVDAEVDPGLFSAEGRIGGGSGPEPAGERLHGVLVGHHDVQPGGDRDPEHGRWHRVLDDDPAFDPAVAEREPLVQRCDHEGGRPAPERRSGCRDETVSIAVGLDHDAQGRSGRQRLAEAARVVRQHGEIHLEPGQPGQGGQAGGGEARLDRRVLGGPGWVRGHGWGTSRGGPRVGRQQTFACVAAKVYYAASGIATASPAHQATLISNPRRKESSLGHRSCGCPHRRRRRLGRRGRPAAGRGRVPGGVPGAGAVARPGGVPRGGAGLGADHAQAVVHQPQRARLSARTTRSTRRMPRSRRSCSRASAARC